MPDIQPNNNGAHIEPAVNVQAAFNDAMDKAKVNEAAEKHTYSFGELWAHRNEKQEFLINDLIPKGVVTVLIGEDGIGKTQLLTQLCFHITLGFPSFLHLPLNTVHQKALIVATEDGKEKFTQAITRQIMALKPNIEPEKVNIFFTEGADFDNFPNLMTEIEKVFKEQKYLDLVVIDAFSDLFTLVDGDINSNTHARFILTKLQALCKRHNTSLVLIHHAAKTKMVNKRREGKIFVEKEDSQGAGAITQKARTVLALTNLPKSITNNGKDYTNFLHVVKANLMDKRYMKRALELGFESDTLLHNFKNLVDIELYESGDGVGDPSDKSSATIQVISYDEHLTKMKEVFARRDHLIRKDLVADMKRVYKCGLTRIERAEGLLHEVINIGVITKTATGYIMKPTTIDTSDIVQQTNLALTKYDNEELPF